MLTPPPQAHFWGTGSLLPGLWGKCKGGEPSPQKLQGLTWAASVGRGCPRPGQWACWCPSRALLGGLCSDWWPSGLGRPLGGGPHGGVVPAPRAHPHTDPDFLGACGAWRAVACWPGTGSWGWRCRGRCRCRCRWSRPWRGGPARAPGGPGGRTSGRRCGCWMRCWRVCCCWSDLSTEALPGRRDEWFTPGLPVGPAALVPPQWSPVVGLAAPPACPSEMEQTLPSPSLEGHERL